MKYENKICFFLNWVREIDMFKNISSNLKKKDKIFIVNDLSKKLNKHKFEREKIIDILKKDNFNFDLLSNVINKKKFKTLLSTADLPTSKLNITSILKYFYGITIGAMIEFLGLHIYLKKIFNREFTYKGFKASLYEELYIEKKISEKTIKYPNGLDRNIKYFPNDKWKHIFDFFLTSSILEKNLIEKKFFGKKVFNVGYSRFDDDNDKKNEKLIKEFKIDKNKKTLLSCPNERIMFEQKKIHIQNYLNFLRSLEKNFNIILRPHPKLQFTKPDYLNLIKNSKIKLDLKLDRNIKDMFLISDLILVDYGSSVLEALYLKKKFIVYEWPQEKKFKVLFDKQNCLDYLIRNKVSESIINLKKKDNFLETINTLINDNKYQNKINLLNDQFFGNKNKIRNSLDLIKKIHYEK